MTEREIIARKLPSERLEKPREEKKKKQPQLEIIPPEIPNSRPRPLFDSEGSWFQALTSWDGENYCDDDFSIFHGNDRARIAINLQGPERVKPHRQTKNPLKYLLVLTGEIQARHDLITAPGFVGPLNSTELLSGSFTAIEISFSCGEIAVALPQYIARSVIGYDHFASPLTTKQEPAKLWLTGSSGKFARDNPGFNPLFHIGLAYAQDQVEETKFHSFRDNVGQLVVPIPTKEQPRPGIFFDLISPGCGSGDITMRIPGSLIESWEVGGLYTTTHQRKIIKSGTLFLIVNSMNRNGQYSKQEGLYSLGDFPWLGPLEEDFWEG